MVINTRAARQPSPGGRRSALKNILVVFPGVLLLTGASSSIGSETWRTFTSNDGGFSILMPSTPALTKKVRHSVVGTIRENTYSLSTPTGEYSVEYSDLPGIAVLLGGKQAILEKAKEGLLKDGAAIEQTSTAIYLGPHPGRELTYDIPATRGTGRARLYLVEERLYVIVGTSDRLHDQNVDRFLRSFRLL